MSSVYETLIIHNNEKPSPILWIIPEYVDAFGKNINGPESSDKNPNQKEIYPSGLLILRYNLLAESIAANGIRIAGTVLIKEWIFPVLVTSIQLSSQGKKPTKNKNTPAISVKRKTSLFCRFFSRYFL